MAGVASIFGAHCARVSVEIARAFLPRVVVSDLAERDAMVVELKAADRGYLDPLFAGSPGG